jgi:alanyl aminopeptidase
MELLGAKTRIMAQDSLAAARPIRRPARSASDIEEVNDFLTYFKGAGVLGMVEAWLGADRFRDGMRGYMKKHAWGNVTAADLYASLTEASGLDVASVMRSFTEQSGLPSVSAELVCDGTPWIRLAQREYRTLDRTAGADKSWRVPVCVVFDAGAKLARRCALLEGSEGRIDLPAGRCPSFVYANADEAGYYRVRPDAARPENAQRALGRLSETERFGLLSNTWAAVWSGDASASSYLELVTAVRDRPSRLVWDQVTDALRELNIALIPDAAQPALAKWVRDVIGPVGRRLGWKAAPGETDDRKIVRQDVLMLLGRLGDDAPTMAEARALADRWLTNPTQVDANLARVALVLTAREGDAVLFDRLLSVFKNASTPEIGQVALRAMASFDRREFAQRALDLIANGSLKGQDVIQVVSPLVRRKETAPLAFEWFESHFDDVAKLAPPYVVQEVLPLVAATLCSEERVRRVDAFFRPRFEKAGTGVKALDQAAEAGLRCALLAGRQGPETAAWLAQRVH